MITDKQLSQVSRDVDDMLMKLVIEHGVSPLSLSAIILARLVHLNDSNDNIFQLCSEVGNKSLLDKKTGAVH